jgi:hypothetical protein
MSNRQTDLPDGQRSCDQNHVGGAGGRLVCVRRWGEIFGVHLMTASVAASGCLP